MHRSTDGACGESLSPHTLVSRSVLIKYFFSCSFFIRRSLVIDFQQSPTCSSFCAFLCDPTPYFLPKKKGLNDTVPRLPNSLIYFVSGGEKETVFEFIFLLRWLCTFFYLGKEGEDREEEISEIEKSETGTAFPEN